MLHVRWWHVCVFGCELFVFFFFLVAKGVTTFIPGHHRGPEKTAMRATIHTAPMALGYSECNLFVSCMFVYLVANWFCFGFFWLPGVSPRLFGGFTAGQKKRLCVVQYITLQRCCGNRTATCSLVACWCVWLRTVFFLDCYGFV